MRNNFQKVKDYLFDLGLPIIEENASEELVIINDEDKGISHMMLDCEGEILVVEQFIMPVPANSPSLLKRLLQMNRDFVHGAFALNEDGSKVIFRDTLQLENLDLNELEATINSLGLLLAEHSTELIEFGND